MLSCECLDALNGPVWSGPDPVETDMSFCALTTCLEAS